MPAGQERRLKRGEKVVRRRERDIQELRAEGLGWRGGIILGWAGMRGVVTLAAAQSLPHGDSVPSPARAHRVHRRRRRPCCCRVARCRGSSSSRRSRAPTARPIAANSRSCSTRWARPASRRSTRPPIELPEGEIVDREVIERVRHDTLLSAEAAWERADHGAGLDGLKHSPQRQYRALRREVLQAEREALLEARSNGTYPSRILTRAQAMLDLEETRLEQIDNPSGGAGRVSHRVGASRAHRLEPCLVPTARAGRLAGAGAGTTTRISTSPAHSSRSSTPRPSATAPGTCSRCRPRTRPRPTRARGAASRSRPGLAHTVTWRADGLMGEADDLAGRRHWHTHCWKIRP